MGAHISRLRAASSSGWYHLRERHMNVLTTSRSIHFENRNRFSFPERSMRWAPEIVNLSVVRLRSESDLGMQHLRKHRGRSGG
jgi:hypothetical protein